MDIRIGHYLGVFSIKLMDIRYDNKYGCDIM